MEKRTARQFSRREVAFIAKSYADSKNDFDYRDYMVFYNISRHTFYKLLERAAVENIVDDDIVRRMREKAIFNVQHKHDGKGIDRINNHYDALEQKRKLYGVTEEVAIQMIKNYSKSEQDKHSFCEEAGMTTQFFDKIMMMYITTSKVDDETFQELSKKGIRNNFSRQAMIFWKEIAKKRKSNLGQG